MVDAGGLDTSLSDTVEDMLRWVNPAGQWPLRRRRRPAHAEPPSPRRPLDLLLVAVAKKGVISQPKLSKMLNSGL